MIELKCPSCKADIILDESREIGFCMYCGTRVLLRETASTVDGIAGINNLLLRANQFLNEGNYDKALEYYNRVLDIDINNLQAQNGIKLINSKRSYLNIGDEVICTVIDATGGNYEECIIVELPNKQIVPLPIKNISPNIDKHDINNGSKYTLICIGYNKNLPQLMTKSVLDNEKQPTFAEQLKINALENTNLATAQQKDYEDQLPQLIMDKIKYECSLRSTNRLQGYFDTHNEGYGIELSFHPNNNIPKFYNIEHINNSGFNLFNPTKLESILKKEIRQLGFDADYCHLIPIKIVQKIGTSFFTGEPKYKNTSKVCYIFSIDIKW